MTDAFDECLKAKATGRSALEAASLMRDNGLTIVEAIQIIMRAYDLPLDAANSAVASAPPWRATIEASAPLHDEVQRAFGDDAASG